MALGTHITAYVNVSISTDSSEIPRILTLLLITLLIKIFLAVITFGCRIPGGIFLPVLIIGGIAGRMIGLSMQHLVMTYPDTWPFKVCSAEIASDQQCIIPGVYAMVGAAAALTGMTRTTGKKKLFSTYIEELFLMHKCLQC